MASTSSASLGLEMFSYPKLEGPRGLWRQFRGLRAFQPPTAEHQATAES